MKLKTKTFLKLAALFLAPLAAGVALAQQAATAPLSVEERLAKLEDEVGALQRENSQLRATVQSIKPGASEQWLSVGGFIMAQAEAGDRIDSRFGGLTANDRIYLRRARVIISGHFADGFDFKIAPEMSGALGDANGSTSMRGQLSDGFIAWTKYPAINLAIGQFKSGFGYDFLYNDATLCTIEHALVTDQLTLNRQIGVQASGALLGSRLTYALGIYNGNATNFSVNDNGQFLYTARLAGAPVKTKIPSLNWDAAWTIGLNAYRSTDGAVTLPGGILPSTTFTGRRTGLGVDTQLVAGSFALWFEYITAKYEPSPSAPPPPGGKTSNTAAGWYLLGEWTFVPKKWQALVRYDTFDPDTRVSKNSTDSWTLGVNYLIHGDDLKLMLDYTTSAPSFRDGATNNFTNPARANRALLRLQAAF